MYNCPDCAKQMVKKAEPIFNVQPNQVEGKAYPSKVVCLVSDVYTCEDCKITLVKTTTEDYYPTTME